MSNRVTPEEIQANIVNEHYFTAAEGVSGAEVIAAAKANDHKLHDKTFSYDDDGPLSLLTFCVLVLQNGFTVVGKSAVASPENFNAEIGRNIARTDAVNQMWPLMGYELKSRLHREALAPVAEPDFLSGAKACDRFDPTCESCQ